MTELKTRCSYLLSAGGGAEEISRKQDSWIYLNFTSALSYDLAKPAVDQAIVIYDKKGGEVPSAWRHLQFQNQATGFNRD